jgi:hypothetical protein
MSLKAPSFIHLLTLPCKTSKDIMVVLRPVSPASESHPAIHAISKPGTYIPSTLVTLSHHTSFWRPHPHHPCLEAHLARAHAAASQPDHTPLAHRAPHRQGRSACAGDSESFLRPVLMSEECGVSTIPRIELIRTTDISAACRTRQAQNP